MLSQRYLSPLIVRNVGSRWIDHIEARSTHVGTRSGGTGPVEWQSRVMTMSLPSLHGKEQLYQIEYGEARLDDPDPGAPAIMAVHPSGSSYRQWSGLKEHIPAGSCSGLYGVNLFGYGRSEAWRREIRPPTTEDLVDLLDAATDHADTSSRGHLEPSSRGLMDTSSRGHTDISSLGHLEPSRRWHLIGHSMGGGAVMAAAASGAPLVDRLEAVTVFEPNLFNLLLAGTEDEKKTYSDATTFFKAMLAAAGGKNWEEWGRLFYKFWFVGKWESLPEEVRNTLIRTTLPHTIYEIESVKSAVDKGPEEAEKMLNNLVKLDCKKKMVISHDTGEGSTACVLAMGNLLQREAGFQIVFAPAGGHMGPLTHKQQVLPLLL